VSSATTTPGGLPAGYPAELESAVLLADGRPAEVRPILPSDFGLLQDLHARLSDQAVYFRFFGPRRKLPEGEFERFVTVDYVDRLALVALVDDELVAVARYDRAPGSPEAEVAFVVRDDQQRRGIGTVLLEHLASAAMAVGIRLFVADTLSENHPMLNVFRRVGFEEHASFEAGVVRVTMELEAAKSYLENVEERDRKAAVASIVRLLRPASIAVVGASRRTGTIGRELLANLVAGGFRGQLYPVNPAGGEIGGLRAYRSVGELPRDVDLVVVAVPASHVAEVVEACGRQGVGGLVVISAGFAETGASGQSAELELVTTARRHGMRLVGPNCMGIVNTSVEVSMNATFSPIAPVRGRIAFSSQSGGLGIAILNEASHRGLGVSSFVSVGNKADVSGNDLLRYWEEDADTDVILLYLESFGNPRHFSRIARRIARKKPIIAVKSGRSPSGARGASSHTAATATADATVDALFRQAGVIRVDTLEELFDVADVASHQPLAAGRGVAIVGNAGGPGVLAADACEGYGLVVPELSEHTQERLRSVLSADAAVGNPVDCIASATAEQYRQALEIVLDDGAIDAVIVIFTPPVATTADEVARAVASVAATAVKPIVANFLTASGTLAALRNGERRVPWFAYPESAARALGRLAPYAAWRQNHEAAVPAFADADPGRARAVVEAALATTAAPPAADDHPAPDDKEIGGRGAGTIETAAAWLDLEATRDVLGAYGIPLAGGAWIASADEAIVAVGEGVEIAVSVVEDRSFGPLLELRFGGTAAILSDRVLSLVPLTRSAAVDLISSLTASRLLTGGGGAPPVDIDALADLLCRVARLAEDLPEIVAMELDPVVARSNGVVVLGCRIRVEIAPVPIPALRRRHLR
jgi:acetyl coenzyme A synthetase (ADP forming)-like protein